MKGDEILQKLEISGRKMLCLGLYWLVILLTVTGASSVKIKCHP